MSNTLMIEVKACPSGEIIVLASDSYASTFLQYVNIEEFAQEIGSRKDLIERIMMEQEFDSIEPGPIRGVSLELDGLEWGDRPALIPGVEKVVGKVGAMTEYLDDLFESLWEGEPEVAE